MNRRRFVQSLAAAAAVAATGVTAARLVHIHKGNWSSRAESGVINLHNVKLQFPKLYPYQVEALRIIDESATMQIRFTKDAVTS